MPYADWDGDSSIEHLPPVLRDSHPLNNTPPPGVCTAPGHQ